MGICWGQHISEWIFLTYTDSFNYCIFQHFIILLSLRQNGKWPGKVFVYYLLFYFFIFGFDVSTEFLYRQNQYCGISLGHPVQNKYITIKWYIIKQKQFLVICMQSIVFLIFLRLPYYYHLIIGATFVRYWCELWHFHQFLYKIIVR